MRATTQRRRRPDTAPAVRVVDVELAHGAHVALSGGSFEVRAGCVAALIGPNGSGKSTVLDAVAGLHRPRSGIIEVAGRRDRTRGSVAYVLQATEVPEHLPITVREVVTMGRYGRTGPWRRLRHEDRAAVEAAMDRLELAHLADRQILELSGGQRQRALVAQGLCAAAPLLLLDEPMTGLDLVSQGLVRRAVAEERAAGRTVLFSTHDLHEAARADVVVLLAGRVVAAGAPEQVLTGDHLADAYRDRLLDVGGIRLIDDPHHHGPRADRHDGHVH